MANYKKMDDHDFVFVNKPLTPEEDKEFSDFLKNRRSRIKTRQNLRTLSRPKRQEA